jgi:hypothetical protein
MSNFILIKLVMLGIVRAGWITDGFVVGVGEAVGLGESGGVGGFEPAITERI